MPFSDVCWLLRPISYSDVYDETVVKPQTSGNWTLSSGVLILQWPTRLVQTDDLIGKTWENHGNFLCKWRFLAGKCLKVNGKLDIDGIVENEIGLRFNIVAFNGICFWQTLQNTLWLVNNGFSRQTREPELVSYSNVNGACDGLLCHGKIHTVLGIR